MEDSLVVAALADHLAGKIGQKRFDLWFGSQTKLCLGADGSLAVRAGSAFARDCLRRNFGEDIRDSWETVGGETKVVEFEVDESVGPAHEAAESQSSCATENICTDVPETKRAARNPSRQTSAGPPRETFSLAGFVVGPSNEYAFRAAELTASGRQQASPVLFCGPTGVGKSHLLRAVQREYRRLRPRATAVYMTAEQFTGGFVHAIRGSGLPSFRQKCRGADLLLIDDVQFFVDKQRTTEELQYTVDAMLGDGRQLVFASDRNLGELGGLGAELCSRLAGGLICRIEPAEFATRLEITRQLAKDIGLAASEEVWSLVATQIYAGARELRGALHRLQTIVHAYGEPLTLESAERALADLARQTTRPVRLADVEKVVCEVFGLEPTRLRSEHKCRAVAEPRMLAMWLARKFTRSAWSEIGQHFGRRSHSTAISAHRRVERLIRSRASIGINDRACGVEEAIRKLETALRTA